MDLVELSFEQQQVAAAPLHPSVYLEGPAGSGKTTAGVRRLRFLLDQCVPGEQILILVPQRSLGLPYAGALADPHLPPGGLPSILTFGGLVKRMVALYWPLIAEEAGFAHPGRQPVFLTMETAQFYMGTLVEPLLFEGYFDSLRMERNRLFSQILDNLNKAAVVGFQHTELAERLKAAWSGSATQLRVYDQMQDCANRFRAYCLEHNLLDFSLQVEIFTRRLAHHPLCSAYLSSHIRHLIYDNVEEDVPVAHDLVGEWLPRLDSALLISDKDAGFRAFLGADPAGAEQLKECCGRVFTFSGSYVTPPLMQRFETVLANRLASRPADPPEPELRILLQVRQGRFYPDMITKVCAEVADLVRSGECPPGEIAILSPYLSDSLRFAIQNQLKSRGIPSRSNRPSRSLMAEPATRSLLTLAKLAHPEWGYRPGEEDLRSALFFCIEDLDYLRAALLTQMRYSVAKGNLVKYADAPPDYQQRIGYRNGELFDRLVDWITEYRQNPAPTLDLFLARLFGEVLSQPGFAFHRRYDQAEITARVIESVQKFRRGWVPAPDRPDISPAQQYVEVMEKGLLAATYLPGWEEELEDAVRLMPAHTFLMENRPAQVQFWLDVGSYGWWQRLYQPLTQPHVLTRRWPHDQRWTDVHEYRANQEHLARLVRGLVRRCSGEVRLYAVGVNEGGSEERGPLLLALQGLLRQMLAAEVQHG